MQKIKEQLEEGFKKIQQAVDTSSLIDLRQRVQTAIAEVRTDVNEHLDKFKEANAVADQFVDPYLEQATRSKWTALIVAAGTLIAVSVGVIIGMHL